VPTLETPMSPGGLQASAGEGLSPCNIGINIGIVLPLNKANAKKRHHSLPGVTTSPMDIRCKQFMPGWHGMWTCNGSIDII